MLLEMNEPAQALVQFEATLKKEPRRFRSLYGAAHAAQLSGKTDVSKRYFAELLTVCEHSDKPGRSEITEARDALAKRGIYGCDRESRFSPVGQIPLSSG